MANGGVAGFGRWLGQGVRAAFFVAPRWERLRASPAMLVALCGISVLLAALTDRLMVDGPAVFSWQALAGNWLAVLLLAWTAYAARRGVVAAPTVAQTLTLAVAQLLVLTLFSNMYAVWMVRSGRFDALSDTAQDWVLLLPVLWIAPAQFTLLMRCRVRGRAPALAVLAGVAALALAFCALPPAPYWRAPDPGLATPFQLTQELIEAQLPLLGEQIKALKPQRPGVVDMYTITFAPYGGEDVFKRESSMVAAVMAQRFDADGRGIWWSDSHPLSQCVWHAPLADDGTVGKRRLVIDMHDLPGRPDGAAIDVDGGYWICANDGGRIVRLTPDGRVDRSIAVPVSKPSMCSFGGAALDTLFVTSIQPPNPQGDDIELAGEVFALRPGTQGLAETPFRPR